MASIITGNDLGLLNSSLTNVGKISGEKASFGQTNESVYVNAATGNVVVQQVDEIVVGQGIDTSLLRTYNRMGIIDGDNNDAWRIGLNQSVVLNEQTNQITKTNSDGSEFTYEYDAASGKYLSTDGSGAHDSIEYDASANQWIWTDANTQVKEFYDANTSAKTAGKLVEKSDKNGNLTTYAYKDLTYSFFYTVNVLDKVTESSGQTTTLNYKPLTYNQIPIVESVSTEIINGVEEGAATLLKKVHYDYDLYNRLTTVTVDLSPGDSNILDGNTYTTSYAYNGTTNEINSIIQKDGTSSSIEYYTPFSGETYSRVKTITDGEGRTLRFDYVISSNITHVTDDLGNVTTYKYDTEGKLTQLLTPAVDGQRSVTNYSYDENTDDLIEVTDSKGHSVKYTYDNGNLTKQIDVHGNTVERAYENNLLTSETVYIAPDADGLNAEAAQEPLTTHFSYDANRNLRFSVSADNKLTEYQYNGYGQRISSLQFSNQYDSVISGSLVLADVESWAQGQVDNHLETISRTDTAYDFRGQVERVTVFATLDAGGEALGIIDGNESVTEFIYDSTGKLRKTIDARGVATTIVEDDFTTEYKYDVLGRLTETIDALGNVTHTEYDDQNQRITTTAANDLVITTVYNQAGEIVTIQKTDQQSNDLGESKFHYDAAGKLVCTEDSTGARNYIVYDEAGRQKASINGTGTVTQIDYDSNGRAVKSTGYSLLVDTQNLIDDSGNVSNIDLESLLFQAYTGQEAKHSEDRSSYVVYDDVGRQVFAIDAEGFIAENIYDGASRLTETVKYAEAISTSWSNGLPTVGDVRALLTEFAVKSATITEQVGVLNQPYEFANSARTDVSTLTSTSITIDGSPRYALVDPDQDYLLVEHAYAIQETNTYEDLAIDIVNGGSSGTSDTVSDYAWHNNYGTLEQVAGMSITVEASAYEDATPTSVIATIYDSNGDEYAVVETNVTEITQLGVEPYHSYNTMYTAHNWVGQVNLSLDTPLPDGDYTVDIEIRDDAQAAFAFGEVWDAVDGEWVVNSSVAISVGSSKAIPAISWARATEPADTATVTFKYRAEGSQDEYTSVEIQTTATDRTVDLGETLPGNYELVIEYKDANENVLREFKQTFSALANGTSQVVAQHLLSTQAESVYSIGTSITGYDGLGQIDQIKTIQAEVFDINGSPTDPVSTAQTRPDLQTDYSNDINLSVGEELVDGQYHVKVTETKNDDSVSVTEFDYDIGLQQGTEVVGTNITFDAQIYDWQAGDSGILKFKVDGSADPMTEVAISAPVNGEYIAELPTLLADTQYEYELEFKDEYGRSERWVTSSFTTSATGEFSFSADVEYNERTSVFDETGTSLIDYLTIAEAETIDRIVVDVANDLGTQVSAGVVTIPEVEPGYGRAINLSTDGVLADGVYDIELTIYFKDGTTEQRTISDYEIGAQTFTKQSVFTWDATGQEDGSSVTFECRAFESSDTYISITPTLVDGSYKVVLRNPSDSALLDAGKYEYRITYAGAETVTSTGSLIIDSFDRRDAITIFDATETHTQKRVSRNFYTASGAIEAVLDAEGYLTEFVYNGKGQLVKTTQYSTGASTTVVNGSLVDIKAEIFADSEYDAQDDAITYVYYNRRGEVVAQIDAEGYLTENVYTIESNLDSTLRYAEQVTSAVTVDMNLADIKALIPVDSQTQQHKTQTISYTYTAINQIETLTDYQGTIVTYFYDEMGMLVKTQAGDGTQDANTDAARIAQIKYDIEGRVIAQLSSKGSDLLAAIDPSNQAQVDEVWENYSIKYEYDSVGRKTNAKDQLGNTTTFYYDQAGRLAYSINAAGEVTETIYNAFGQISQSIQYTKAIENFNTLGLTGGLVTNSFKKHLVRTTDDTNGNNDTITKFTYNNRGLLESAIDPLNNIVQSSYTGYGELSTVITPTLGDGTTTTKYEYNDRGLQSKIIADLNGIASTTLSTYDAFGNVKAVTDANQNVTEFGYDKLGRQTSFINPLTHQSLTQYDAFGRITQAQNANLSVTEFVYDDQARSITTKFPGDIQTISTTNRHGEQVSIIDANTNEIRFEYDLDGNLIKTIDAKTNEATTAYDAAGRVDYSIDLNNTKTTFEYDAASRVVKLTADPSAQDYTGLNITTEYSYDNKSNKTGVIDANGVLTTTLYNEAGQVTAIIQDDDIVVAGQTTHIGLKLRTEFTYDKAGNQIAVTAGVGTDQETTTHFVYDNLGKLRFTVATLDGKGIVTESKYDNVGNVISQISYSEDITLLAELTETNLQLAVDDKQSVETKFVYDATNQLRFTIDALGQVQESIYDKVGNIEQTKVYTEAPTLPAELTEAGVATALDAIDSVSSRFVYDGLGRIRFTIDALGYVSENEYDAAGQIVASKQYSKPYVDSIYTETALEAEYQYDVKGAEISSIRATIEIDVDSEKTVVIEGLVSEGDSAITSAVLNIVNTTTAAAYGPFVLDIQADGSYPIALGGLPDGNYKALVTIEDANGKTDTEEVLLTLSDQIDSFIGTVTNEEQIVTRYIYDAVGNVKYSIDTLGYVSKNEYDAAGNITTTHRFEAEYTGTDFTEAGLAAYTDGDQIQRFVYDSLGRVAYTIDTLGYVSKNEYNALGQVEVTKRFEVVYTGQAYTLEAIKDVCEGEFKAPEIGPVKATVETGKVVVIEGVINKGDSALSSTILNIESTTGGTSHGPFLVDVEADGSYIEAYGNLPDDTYKAIISTEDDNGKTDSEEVVFTVSDQSASFLGTVTQDSNFVQTRYIYDSMGRVRFTIDVLGYVSENEYNALGQVEATKRFESDYTGTVFTETALENEYSDSTSQIQRFAYDDLGRTRYTIDAENYVSENIYDALGNVILVKQYDDLFTGTSYALVDFDSQYSDCPKEKTSFRSFVYDSLGRLAYEIDPVWKTTGYEYDALNRVITKTYYANTLDWMYFAEDIYHGEYLEYQGGTHGKIEDVKDPWLLNSNDRTERFVFDSLGQVRFTIDALNHVFEHEYDAYGQVEAVKKYETEYTQSDFSLTAFENEYSSGAVQTQRYIYDDLGRTKYQINANGGLIENIYDSYSNIVKSIVYSQTLTDSATLSSDDLITQINLIKAGDVSTSRSVGKVYDGLGRLLYDINTTGTAVGYEYDTLGRVAEKNFYASVFWSGITAVIATQDEDDAGGILNKIEQIKLFLFGHAQDRVERYVYDDLGRVLYSVDNSGSVIHSQYDQNGNATIQTKYKANIELVEGLTKQYIASQLETILGTDYENSVDQLATVYVYDDLGRVKYSISNAGTAEYITYTATGQLEQRTSYSALVFKGELQDYLAETINSSQLETRIEAGIALSSSQEKDRTVRNVYNDLGQLRFVINNDGAVRESKYSAFGEIVEQSQYSVKLLGIESLEITETAIEASLTTAINTAYGSTEDQNIRTSRYFYDANGNVRFELDALGYLTEVSYTAIGEVYQTTRTTLQIDASVIGAQSTQSLEVELQNFKAQIQADGLLTEQQKLNAQRVETNIYNDAGELRFQIDSMGFVTESKYNSFGELTEQMRYVQAVSSYEDNALTQAHTYVIDDFSRETDPLILKDHGDNRTQRKFYEGDGKEKYTIDAQGFITEVVYDVYGNVERRIRYDNVFSVNEGAKTSDIAQTVLDFISGEDYDELEYRADLFVYNESNQVQYEVDSAGKITQYFYDAFGNVTKTAEYGSPFDRADGNLIESNGQNIKPTLEIFILSSTDNRVTYYFYNDQNKLAFTVNALGYATENDYNSFGEVISTRQYAQIVDPADPTLTQATLPKSDKDKITLYYYDNLGRLAYEFNENADFDKDGNVSNSKYTVVQKEYSIFDELETNTVHSEQVAAALVNATGFATDITSLVQAGGADRQATYEYSDRGRVTNEKVTVNTVGEEYETVRVYDEFGNNTTTIQGAGRSDVRIVTNEFNKRDQITVDTIHGVYGSSPEQVIQKTYTYDSFGNIKMAVDARAYTATMDDSIGSVAAREALGIYKSSANLAESEKLFIVNRYTTRLYYDKLDRKTTEFDGESNTIKNYYDAFGNLEAVQDKNGRIGIFAYNKANQVAIHVDPEGGVTEYKYDVFGNIESMLVFADKTYSYANPDNEETTYTYDDLGRVETTTNAEGYVETSNYDAFGNKIKVDRQIDHLGNEISYDYIFDKAGRMVYEKLPVDTDREQLLGRDSQVINATAYDAFGNATDKYEGYGLEEEYHTEYQYDLLGRLDKQYDNLVLGQAERGLTQHTYDSRGNLVQVENPLGDITTNYYDTANRLVAQVDTEGYLHQFGYDAVGNLVYKKIYQEKLTAAIDINQIPQMDVDIESQEEFFYFDIAGRDIGHKTESVHLFDSNQIASQATNVGFYSSQVHTQNFYDGNGNLIKEIDGRGNSVYHIYDKVGNERATIDAGGYIVTREYNLVGRMEKETLHAGKLSQSTCVSLNQNTDIQSLIDEVTANLSVENADKDAELQTHDRVTSYTYNKLGMLLEKRVQDVTARASYNEGGDQINTSGQVDASSTSGDVVTTYKYDGLGNVTKVIGGESTFGEQNIYRDAMGREKLVMSPSYTDVDGELVTPAKYMEYDALGNLIREIHIGKDAVINDDGEVVSFGSRDQEKRFEYSSKTVYREYTDSEYKDTVTKENSFDILGRIESSTQFITDADGNKHEYITDIDYTKKGKIEEQTQYEVGQESAALATQFDYDVFGNLVRKGINDGWQEQYSYNAQGKLVKEIGADGIPKLYMYDASGNKTLELRAFDLEASTDFNAITSWDVKNLSLEEFQRFISVYDERNLLTDVFQPPKEYLVPKGQIIDGAWVEEITDEPAPQIDFILASVGDGTINKMDSDPFGVSVTEYPKTANWYFEGIYKVTREFNVNFELPEVTGLGDGDIVVTFEVSNFEVTGFDDLTLAGVMTKSLIVGSQESLTTPTQVNMNLLGIHTSDNDHVGMDVAGQLAAEADIYDYSLSVIKKVYNYETGQTEDYVLLDKNWTKQYETVTHNDGDPLNPIWREEVVLNDSNTVAQMEQYISFTGMPKDSTPAENQMRIRYQQDDGQYTQWFFATNNANGTYFVNNDRIVTRSDGTTIFEYEICDSSLADAAILENGHGKGTITNGNVNLFIEKLVTEENLDTDDYLSYLSQFIGLEGSAEAFIHRQQKFNAFGEVISEIDAKSNATNYHYNEMGNLTHKIDAAAASVIVNSENNNQIVSGLSLNTDGTVDYSNEGGAVSRITESVARIYYDAMGNQTKVVDANGNITRNIYIGGKLYKTIHPSELAVDQIFYDEFGNKAHQWHGSEEHEFYIYDKNNNQVVKEHRYIDTSAGTNIVAAKDTYTYDELGNQLSHRNALDYDENGDLLVPLIGYTVSTEDTDDQDRYSHMGQKLWNDTHRLFDQYTGGKEATHVERYYYDAFGRMTKHRSYAGRETSYQYDYLSSIGNVGGFRLTTTLADGVSNTERHSDYYGLKHNSVDLSGRVTSYIYNDSRWLVSQSNSDISQAGIDYIYYRNGLLKAVEEFGPVQTEVTEKIATAEDKLTNKRYIGRTSGWEVISQAFYNYDANGNKVREIFSKDGNVYQDTRVEYDSRNRMTKISDNLYSATYIYDEIGNRINVHADYSKDVDNGIEAKTQDLWYTYDGLNRFTTSMGKRDVGTNAITAETGYKITYDSLGRRAQVASVLKSDGSFDIEENYYYDENGYLEYIYINDTMVEDNASNPINFRGKRINDKVGRVQEYIEQQYFRMGDEPDALYSLVETSRHKMRYDQDGIKVYDNNEYGYAAPIEEKYSQVAEQRMHLLADGRLDKITSSSERHKYSRTHYTTQYQYAGWDSYKQTEISTRADNPDATTEGNEGATVFSYDQYGHLIQAEDRDVRDTIYKRMTYLNDAEGKTYTRYEQTWQNEDHNSVNGTKFNRFYYLNGMAIGDIGSHNEENKDYAQTIREKELESDGNNFHVLQNLMYLQKITQINQLRNYYQSKTSSVAQSQVVSTEYGELIQGNTAQSQVDMLDSLAVIEPGRSDGVYTENDFPNGPVGPTNELNGDLTRINSQSRAASDEYSMAAAINSSGVPSNAEDYRYVDIAERESPISSADFDQSFKPISLVGPEGSPSTYVTVDGDTLREIAMRLYQDAEKWTVLADANPGLDPNANLGDGRVLTIPPMMNSSNSYQTYRAFDPNEIMGDVSPTLPPIDLDPDYVCSLRDIITSVIAIIVSAVVAFYTGNVGMLMNSVNQANNMARGKQEDFDFKSFIEVSVATGVAYVVAQFMAAAFTDVGAATAGNGSNVGSSASSSGASSMPEQAAWLGTDGTIGTIDIGPPAPTSAVSGSWVNGAVKGAVNNITSQVMANATGSQDGFDWAAMAVGALMGSISEGSGMFGDGSDFDPSKTSGAELYANNIGKSMFNGMLSSSMHELFDQEKYYEMQGEGENPIDAKGSSNFYSEMIGWILSGTFSSAHAVNDYKTQIAQQQRLVSKIMAVVDQHNTNLMSDYDLFAGAAYSEIAATSVGGAASRGNPDVFSIMPGSNLHKAIYEDLQHWGDHQPWPSPISDFGTSSTHMPMWTDEANYGQSEAIQQDSFKRFVMARSWKNPNEFADPDQITREAESLIGTMGVLISRDEDAARNSLVSLVGSENADAAFSLIYDYMGYGFINSVGKDVLNINKPSVDSVREQLGEMMNNNAVHLNRLSLELDLYLDVKHDNSARTRLNFSDYADGHGLMFSPLTLEFLSNPSADRFNNLGDVSLSDALKEEIPVWGPFIQSSDIIDRMSNDQQILDDLYSVGLIGYTDYDEKSSDAFWNKVGSTVNKYSAGVAKAKWLSKAVTGLDIVRASNKLGVAGDVARAFKNSGKLLDTGRLVEKYMPGFLKGKRVAVGGAATSGGYLHGLQEAGFFKPLKEMPTTVKGQDEAAVKIVKLLNERAPGLDTSNIKFMADPGMIGTDEWASYGKIKQQINKRIDFDDLTSSGDMIVRFSPEILRNDGQALAVFAHEVKEINLLEEYFDKNGLQTVAQYGDLIDSASAANFHYQGVKIGDKIGAKYLIDNGLMSKDDWADILINKYSYR